MPKVIDRWGNEIELTNERWAYISRWHPDLADYQDEVLKAIKHGRRKQDPLEPTKYLYYRQTDALLPEYNHIVVVVKLIRNNFVVTAYPKFIHKKR
jgi:hypothetical protein